MNARESYDQCCDCECSSHQIRACGGCPRQARTEPRRDSGTEMLAGALVVLIVVVLVVLVSVHLAVKAVA